MTEDLDSKIIHQIEYYFGDFNLPRDKFLQEKIKEDEGWINVDVMLLFKRLAALSKDPEVIIGALKKSTSGLIEISEDGQKIRRNPVLELPEWNEERKKEIMSRTAYAKGFPLEEQLSDIIKFMEAYGSIESCLRRNGRDNAFKGSCFIIFKSKEDCEKFIASENVKYKDVDLIRKWQEEYFGCKRKEIADKIAGKKAKKAEQFKLEKSQVVLPAGSVLHFSGITENSKITREDIKNKIMELEGGKVAYIEFSVGEVQGYVRFAEENGGIDFFAKLGDDKELTVGESKLKIRLLEGEEEKEYLNKSIEALVTLRNKSKSGRKRRNNTQAEKQDVSEPKIAKSE